MAEKNTIIDLSDFFLEVGLVHITGFGAEAIKLPSPESIVTSKKGIDGVAWLKQNPLSQELASTVTLMANSPSVKVLKGFEKTGVIVPFRFEWEQLGIFVEALDCRVEETGELTIGTEMPEIVFTITLKNFLEIKGL
jgi:hypothetical protein